MGWLLDTNVLSELRRPVPSFRVIAYLESWPLDQLHIGSVVLAEIRFGIEPQPEQSRRLALNTWLTKTIRPMFAGRVLEITEDVLLRWRLLVEEGRKVGRTYSEPDLLLAATAIERGLTLVTRNVRDFDGLPVSILNPWED